MSLSRYTCSCTWSYGEMAVTIPPSLERRREWFHFDVLRGFLPRTNRIRLRDTLLHLGLLSCSLSSHYKVQQHPCVARNTEKRATRNAHRSLTIASHNQLISFELQTFVLAAFILHLQAGPVDAPPQPDVHLQHPITMQALHKHSIPTLGFDDFLVL